MQPTAIDLRGYFAPYVHRTLNGDASWQILWLVASAQSAFEFDRLQCSLDHMSAETRARWPLEGAASDLRGVKVIPLAPSCVLLEYTAYRSDSSDKDIWLGTLRESVRILVDEHHATLIQGVPASYWLQR